MPSTAYNSLLAVAEKVKLWITPARQTFAELPSGAVPLWSEEFFTWCLAKFNFQNFPAPITYNRVLRALDETAQAQPREQIQEANLRTAGTKSGYEIDLGNQSIQVTGKEWKITHDGGPGLEPGNRFIRPIASHPLPTPTHSETPLPAHLRAAFGLKQTKSPQDDPAEALAQWLELALRPDTPCPPLILTGELRDEAATAIRQLIDPASCAMLPFPMSRNEAGWMALYNRILAFQVIGTITEFKRGIIRELSQNLFNARIRQTDHKGPKRYRQLGRPVIISIETAPEISANQIHIEIQKCAPLPQQEVLAALLNQMVRSLRNEPKPQFQPTHKAPLISLPSLAAIQAGAPIP